jgi:phospholipid/cholesterol/gamma-HCH transport system ATP-binding protein
MGGESQPACVLEFENVTIPPRFAGTASIAAVSFCLTAGEVAVIRVEENSDPLPLADAAEGLLAPEEGGTVRFMGENWSAMGAARESAMRGRIRRVFELEGWISNLDVIENIVLAEAHHTRRPLAELRAEADKLALLFGLSGVPDGRPATQPGMVLRKLEWVRAFMGRPDLIILDRFVLGVPRDDVCLLMEAIRRAVGQGAAVLWTTLEPFVWDYRGLPKVTRYAMRGPRLTLENRG